MCVCVCVRVRVFVCFMWGCVVLLRIVLGPFRNMSAKPASWCITSLVVASSSHGLSSVKCHLSLCVPTAPWYCGCDRTSGRTDGRTNGRTDVTCRNENM